MSATNTPPDSPLLPLDGIEIAETPDFRLEDALWRRGHALVAGSDEAGRGPLAGPVVAAAVILDPERTPRGLNDSKKLSARRREDLCSEILDMAVSVCVVSLSATAIDQTNILRASLTAMRRAIEGLSVTPAAALFDGRDVPPGLTLSGPAQAAIKGDARSLSVAAASIVAKVTRDRMMGQAAQQYPQYGLERHMGYGSKAHRDAIMQHGGVPRLHRFTFSPLKT